MKLPSLCFCVLILVIGHTFVLGADPTVYEIQSRWDQKRYLTIDNDQVRAAARQGDLSSWTLEPSGGGYVIRNLETRQYLQVKDDVGALQLRDGDPSDDHGRWTPSPVGTYASLHNLATGGYLNIEKQSGPDASLTKRPDAKNWWSGLWILNHVAGPAPERFYINGQVVIKTPAYGSEIHGDTTLEVRAPGLRHVIVKSWLPGDSFGKDSTIGQIDLDEAGRGTILFPADKYPHGPITIRVSGGEGKTISNYYLMVYNKGGVAWNEGLPKDAPEPAKGMELVYADDFTDPHLSISRDGQGTTYMSHKPGGGDFSGIPFADHEDSQKTPFSQVDTYLRIRADQSKNTTGLISSLRKDGTGFTVTAPCYFECRFIAQSAPGTWPAFWAMTRDVYKGLKVPADEFDIIEAYGGEGKGNPNQRGYWIASHYWNQGEDGGKDYSQPRVYKQIAMTELNGAGGSSWFETFHTYGLLIGDEETVYYCDGIEVARHKTSRLARQEPLFFFINLAVGGASRWPIDLSQTSGLADMYVDWVRIYGKKSVH